MSDITGTAVAHEAYAFCCMRCGHGWEQAYDIEHHVDGSGQNYVVYKTDGARVPSPLSSPNCVNCGGHVVRIMRSGQVSSVRALMAGQLPGQASGRSGEAIPGGSAEQISAGSARAGAASEGKAPEHDHEHHWNWGHWHLSDLLHPFHHRK
ncbi:hypothetical protein [Streptomyces odonnellii]|uniref:hypothetical protein n=1 Tax=Streptomyces odonnellii TaxID=1417980 RepID=UPI000626615C|nr:hypothetical protein [Streptomyces odonnellii]